MTEKIGGRLSSPVTLSVVVPCYNEERTLQDCLENILKIADDDLKLDIIVVDDRSNDESFKIATDLAQKHKEISVYRHDVNLGKGAALRTGFQMANGNLVAVQDADLEYDPNDLKRLLRPLIEGYADVVFGSRFLSIGAHRVLYFWHYLGNRFLTLISNMFTDLNLTDMEACYKVFRREIIQSVEIKENRFGFEPEIVAKIAQMRLRVYEMGISYRGRTYEEGKKIGVKDGFRALYCVFRYNAFRAPLPIQLLIYAAIGAIAGIINLTMFLILLSINISVNFSIPFAFITAAVINYLLCIAILFKHASRWTKNTEIVFYLVVVFFTGVVDFGITKFFLASNFTPFASKLFAIFSGFLLNFVGRRFLVFPGPRLGPWKNQTHNI